MSAQNPQKKSLIEPLITTAAISGLVQGVSWFVLSIIAILYYSECMTPSNDFIKNNVIGISIYNIYLNKNYDSSSENILVTPKVFNIFMYFYMLVSFTLLIVSSVILWAVIRKKNDRFRQVNLGAWTVIVGISSILDFILLCLIAHDYQEVKNLQMPPELTDVLIVTCIEVAVGIVMTLAARGFLLWLINVIFVAILGKHVYIQHNRVSNQRQPFINAYDSSSNHPWNQSTYFEPPSGRSNKGFRADDEFSMFTPSQSFQSMSFGGKDNYDPKSRDPIIFGRPNDQSAVNVWDRNNQRGGQYGMGGFGGNEKLSRSQPQQERVTDGPGPWAQPSPFRSAKTGRQGDLRNAPININSPNIPDPDYSPPGSPRVRGVLRPKSNYAMY